MNKKVTAFKSCGKHFLICFDDFTLRIHFLLFGSYLVNKQKDRSERLRLKFSNGELNLYACAIRIIEEDIDELYDWSADVMNEEWDEKEAKAKLRKAPAKLVCDALLEQEIFAGVGNIIKNEVLYRIRVHPESKVGKLPASRLRSMVQEARIYNFDFLEWKKKFVLRKHWLAHAKKTCARCSLHMIKKITGVKKRRSFFCENCQVLYK